MKRIKNKISSTLSKPTNTDFIKDFIIFYNRTLRTLKGKDKIKRHQPYDFRLDNQNVVVEIADMGVL